MLTLGWPFFQGVHVITGTHLSGSSADHFEVDRLHSETAGSHESDALVAPRLRAVSRRAGVHAARLRAVSVRPVFIVNLTALLCGSL